jgi:sigma-B regulation protein RsbU (phosphoserine phosphatase)
MMNTFTGPDAAGAQGALAAQVAAAAREAALDANAAHHLQEAAAELVAGVLANAPEPVTLQVRTHVGASALTVSLEDDGPPRASALPQPDGAPDRHAVPDGVDEVVYERVGGWNRTNLSMRRTGELGDLGEASHQFADDLLRVILPLGIALSGESDFDRLLERILIEVKCLCRADGGTLYLREGDQLRFVTLLNDTLGLAAGGTTGQAIDQPPVPLIEPDTGRPNYRHVASCATLLGHAIHIPDIYHAPDFDFSGTRTFDERNGYRSVSALTIPLKSHEGTVMGVLQLLNSRDPQSGAVTAFDPYLQRVAEALASQAAVVLNNRLLLQRQVELLRFEHELQIGREMQATFLPAELPQPPGWEIAGEFRPAREVAGDFYDAFYLGAEGHVGIVMADVCGKGVGAALFMALIRTLVRAFIDLYCDPPGARPAADDPTPLTRPLELANAYLLRHHAAAVMFATFFFGLLDVKTGKLRYVNAGHNPPLHVGSGGVRASLGASAPAVGMVEQFQPQVEEISFAPGDVLVAYTDGLTEAQDAAGESFGEERMRALLDDLPDSAAALTHRLCDAVSEFVGATEQFDDITLLTVRRAIL